MMHLGHNQLVVDGVSSLSRCLLIDVPLVISGQFLLSWFSLSFPATYLSSIFVAVVVVTVFVL